MRQRNYGRDFELTFRMGFTLLLLALVYVFFLGLLMFAGIPWEFVLILAIGMAFFQYFMSDKLVLATTGAKEVSAEEEPRLHATVERLAAIADIPKPKKIAVMETHVPNAFATGRNPKNAVIAVTRGLMSRLNERELEAGARTRTGACEEPRCYGAHMGEHHRDSGGLPIANAILD